VYSQNTFDGVFMDNKSIDFVLIMFFNHNIFCTKVTYHKLGLRASNFEQRLQSSARFSAAITMREKNRITE